MGHLCWRQYAAGYLMGSSDLAWIRMVLMDSGQSEIFAGSDVFVHAALSPHTDYLWMNLEF